MRICTRREKCPRATVFEKGQLLRGLAYKLFKTRAERRFVAVGSFIVRAKRRLETAACARIQMYKMRESGRGLWVFSPVGLDRVVPAVHRREEHDAQV